MRDLTLILDMSGSMAEVVDDTLGGVNGMLKDQRSQGDDCRFTLVVFAERPEVIFDHAPLAEIPRIDGNHYQPGGGTALLDAIGETISKKRLKFAKDGGKPEIVRLAIMTDGQENLSRKFKKDEVTALLKEVEDEGWEIVFAGADLDQVADVAAMSGGHTYTTGYTASPAGTRQTLGGMSMYFSTGSVGDLQPKVDEGATPPESAGEDQSEA